jgi:hypothetical protein
MKDLYKPVSEASESKSEVAFSDAGALNLGFEPEYEGEIFYRHAITVFGGMAKAVEDFLSNGKGGITFKRLLPFVEGEAQEPKCIADGRFGSENSWMSSEEGYVSFVFSSAGMEEPFRDALLKLFPKARWWITRYEENTQFYEQNPAIADEWFVTSIFPPEMSDEEIMAFEI